MRRHSILLTLTMLAGTWLPGCHSPTPLPGSTRPDAWQEKFAALDCSNPRHSYDMPRTGPMLFAMIGICRRASIEKEPQHGDQTLVAVDAATDEVRAIPIASVPSGGVHFTETGDVVWYSSGNNGEAERTQRYIEAFVLTKGELKQRSLGRIEVSFVAGSGIGFWRGDGCSLLSIQNSRPDLNTPILRQHVLVNDNKPFASARRIDGIGRALFWDPLRKHFVVQREPYYDHGPRLPPPLTRYALDCEGNTGSVHPELSRRIDGVVDQSASYAMSAKGDLIVRSQESRSGADRVTVFYGDKASHIEAPASFADCPDISCAPSHAPLSSAMWSRSGEYFMLDVGFSVVHVFRAADMQTVKRWEMEDSNELPAHGFIDDHAAYQFNDHSRLRFQEW